jgi:signal transduction histidine kinase
VAVFVELFLQSEQLKQRKAAEARLRDTQARLAMALEAGQLWAWEWSLLTDEVSWSPMLAAIHGRPVGNFDGAGAGYPFDIHPADRERVLTTLSDSVKERHAHRLQYRILRPDGQVRWIEAQGQLVEDPEGEPLRLVGVCHDITDRRLAEESARLLAIEETARRAAEAAQGELFRDIMARKNVEGILALQVRHSALRAEVSMALGKSGDLRQLLHRCCEALVTHLEVTLAAVWMLSSDGKLLELQASAGLSTHVDEAHARVPVGKYKIGLIAERQKPEMTNDLANDPDAGDPAWLVREQLVALAGYPLMVESRCIGVVVMLAREKLADGTLNALGTVADAMAQGIERQLAEEALQARARELARSNAELERFAYVASHDLQEPLRMVASYTQLLGRRYKGKLDDDADDFIAYVSDGIARMQALINDLLMFSRVGTKGGEMVPLELGGPLSAALQNLRLAIEASQATITHEVLPKVTANEAQMVQLLQNLIANAIKFRRDVPLHIHIAAEPVGGDWQISVADNGIGIDAEFFSRLFVVFARLHTRSEYPGNGIGLAICKKIIERHGGRIWLESVLGQSTTFFFTLRGVST